MRVRLLQFVLATLLTVVCHPLHAQKLYRHVDEKGQVTFSDRPPVADQKTEKLRAPNVASPEATRQLQIQAREQAREEQAERAAQQRRHAEQRRRDADSERERRKQEKGSGSANPEPVYPRMRR